MISAGMPHPCGMASRTPISPAVNAHKWLGAVFDCSLYYVRNPEHLVRVMTTNPSYLRTDADAAPPTCAIGVFRSGAGSAR